jgi:hypothetical protein
MFFNLRGCYSLIMNYANRSVVSIISGFVIGLFVTPTVADFLGWNEFRYLYFTWGLLVVVGSIFSAIVYKLLSVFLSKKSKR